MRELQELKSNVSRETSEKLASLESLVKKWNPKINLIAPKSMEEIVNRHILDSLQLVSHAPQPESWIDLGSGGGFPGLVVAIAIQEKNPQDIVFVESDARKCAFLRTVLRELDLTGTVVNGRIEASDLKRASTVSARALASLPQLLQYTVGIIETDGTALFPKGKNWEKEVEVARFQWSFDLDVVESLTDPNAAVLKVKHIQMRDTHEE